MSSGDGIGQRPAYRPAFWAYLGWASLGVVLGGLFGESGWDALSGAAVGALFAGLRSQARHATAIEGSIARIERRLDALSLERAPRAEAPAREALAPTQPPA